jgi:hypothetical protein
VQPQVEDEEGSETEETLTETGDLNEIGELNGGGGGGPYLQRMNEDDTPYVGRNDGIDDNPYVERNDGIDDNPYVERNVGIDDNPYVERNVGIDDNPYVERNDGIDDNPYVERNEGVTLLGEMGGDGASAYLQRTNDNDQPYVERNEGVTLLGETEGGGVNPYVQRNDGIDDNPYVERNEGVTLLGGTEGGGASAYLQRTNDNDEPYVERNEGVTLLGGTEGGGSSYLERTNDNDEPYVEKNKGVTLLGGTEGGGSSYLQRTNDNDEPYVERNGGVTLLGGTEGVAQTTQPKIEEQPKIEQKPKEPALRYANPEKLAKMNLWDKVGLAQDGKGQMPQLPIEERQEGLQPKVIEPRNWSWKNKKSDPKQPKPLLTKSLDKDYVGEDKGQSWAENNNKLSKDLLGTPVTSTYYPEDSTEFSSKVEEREQRKVLTQGGKVLNSTDTVGPDGKIEEGSQAMYIKDQHERLNFAFDGGGGLHTSDPATETMRQLDIVNNVAQRHNHSSLVGGKEVSSAGTIKVRQGQVEEVSDLSGHYKPSIVHTQQAVEQLQKSGVMDEQRSSVRLGGKGGNRDLMVSGTEFSSWKDRIDQARQSFDQSGNEQELVKPEQEIRALHEKKSSAQEQLKRVDKRIPTLESKGIVLVNDPNRKHRIDPKQDRGVVEEPTIKPSKVKDISVKDQREEEIRKQREQERTREREERERKRLERQKKKENK